LKSLRPSQRLWGISKIQTCRFFSDNFGHLAGKVFRRLERFSTGKLTDSWSDDKMAAQCTNDEIIKRENVEAADNQPTNGCNNDVQIIGRLMSEQHVAAKVSIFS